MLQFILLGLGVGIAVGLMGVGGGVVLVPALVYLVGMEQHLAQGTSLLMQLPPVGLGALWVYWKKDQVDLRAGLVCALGFLAGGYFGSRLAIGVSSENLRGLFGLFLMFAAVMLVRQTLRPPDSAGAEAAPSLRLGQGAGAERPPDRWRARLVKIFAAATGVGVLGGMFGVGGGIVLVPLLVLLFRFEQHRAQGTSLVALVPPTGLLAFLEYYRADYVDWRAGLLMIPGVFLGGIAGSKLAQRISPAWMRRVFAAFLFLLGAWQAASVWLF